jgi:hypothetical protein
MDVAISEIVCRRPSTSTKSGRGVLDGSKPSPTKLAHFFKGWKAEITGLALIQSYNRLRR